MVTLSIPRCFIYSTNLSKFSPHVRFTHITWGRVIYRGCNLPSRKMEKTLSLKLPQFLIKENCVLLYVIKTIMRNNGLKHGGMIHNVGAELGFFCLGGSNFVTNILVLSQDTYIHKYKLSHMYICKIIFQGNLSSFKLQYCIEVV